MAMSASSVTTSMRSASVKTKRTKRKKRRRAEPVMNMDR